MAVAKDRFSDFDDRRIIREGVNRELESLDILLWAKVNRTAITIDEYIKLSLAQGGTIEGIREDLMKDLAEGGRIFGEFRRALVPTFSGSVNRFRDVGSLMSFDIKSIFRWIAILVNTCPDCLGRHGKTHTWAEWEVEGLPRSGRTVCKEHCKCVLVPAEATEMEPIYREN